MNLSYYANWSKFKTLWKSSKTKFKHEFWIHAYHHSYGALLVFTWVVRALSWRDLYNMDSNIAKPILRFLWPISRSVFDRTNIGTFWRNVSIQILQPPRRNINGHFVFCTVRHHLVYISSLKSSDFSHMGYTFGSPSKRWIQSECKLCVESNGIYVAFCNVFFPSSLGLSRRIRRGLRVSKCLLSVLPAHGIHLNFSMVRKSFCDAQSP